MIVGNERVDIMGRGGDNVLEKGDLDLRCLSGYPQLELSCP